MPLLFIYGTLRLGACNHSEMQGQRYVGPAWTEPGWTLIQLDGYPGLVPMPGRWGVTGEVWEVDSAALRRLDDFEGVSEGLFCREPIALLGRPPGVPPQVDTYRYARSWTGAPEIGRTWRD